MAIAIAVIVFMGLVVVVFFIALVLSALGLSVFGENEKQRGERVYREYTKWKEEREKEER